MPAQPRPRRRTKEPASTPRRVLTAPAEDARARILHTAYALFATHGIRAVGVDRIVAEAGVAKLTLYRHFRSKEALVAATLDLREELWTFQWLLAEAQRRGTTAEERMLAIFDVFDEWFRRDDYEGCMFINTLIEAHDRGSPQGAAAASHLETIRAELATLARAAGARDPESLSRTWQILMCGSIVQAAQGYRNAARLARVAGEAVLAGVR
jgi:AcrR family transcriptional regulator